MRAKLTMFQVNDRVRMYMDQRSYVGGKVVAIHGDSMTVLRDDFEDGTMICKLDGCIPLWGVEERVEKI
jgi:hypothetical protein